MLSINEFVSIFPRICCAIKLIYLFFTLLRQIFSCISDFFSHFLHSLLQGHWFFPFLLFSLFFSFSSYSLILSQAFLLFYCQSCLFYSTCAKLFVSYIKMFWSSVCFLNSTVSFFMALCYFNSLPLSNYFCKCVPIKIFYSIKYSKRNLGVFLWVVFSCRWVFHFSFVCLISFFNICFLKM